VFLTQVTRSPVVRRAGAPGEYVLDRDAPAALRRRLADQHERLRRHAADRDHREALHAVVAQTERALEEAERSLPRPAAALAQEPVEHARRLAAASGSSTAS
jgi:hypothetical protein